MNMEPISQGKTSLSVSPKNKSELIKPSADLDELSHWAQLYYQVHVLGSPEKTIEAKTYNLKLFLDFFSIQVGADQVDLWTPSISKAFRTALTRSYTANTINRVLATLRHFASWIGEYRQFMAGHPFTGVKDLVTDEPAWKRIPKRQVMLLKSACDIRLASAMRKDQDPLLETTVFYVLLHTGMRESELASINNGQYYDKGFH